MRVLVTGAGGQLGRDMTAALCRRGHDVTGCGRSAACSGLASADRTAEEGMSAAMTAEEGMSAAMTAKDGMSAGMTAKDGMSAGMESEGGTSAAKGTVEYVQLDITDEEKVFEIFEAVKPEVVINCAAWTAVDDAEDEANRFKVRAINGLGPLYLAKACRKYGSRMIHLSTDYVFDGNGDTPIQPDCRNYSPLNYYGETKLEGEKAVASILDEYFIVRIAWAFGLYGRNFVSTMLNAAETHNELKVVNDQIGTPTYLADLAELLADMAECTNPARFGYYHATNEGGFISWYDFACEIFNTAARLGYTEFARKELKVIPVTTEEYGLSKALRPRNSRLDKSKLALNGFTPLPDWRDALERYLRRVLAR